MIQFDKYFLNGFEAPTSLQPLRLTLRSEIRPLDMFNQKQLTSAIDGVNYAPRKLTWIPKMMLWKKVSPFEVWCPQRLCCHSNPAAILRNPDTWSSFQLAAAFVALNDVWTFCFPNPTDYSTERHTGFCESYAPPMWCQLGRRPLSH